MPQYLKLIAALGFFSGPVIASNAYTAPLRVSSNGHHLIANKTPFFWLGDTGWLLLGRLDREETDLYLETRKRQGFNVIQVMVLHTPEMTNRYESRALIDGDPAQPRVTRGNNPAKPGEYDYWDHLDWVLERANAKGIYLALVPAWGSVADGGQLNVESAKSYGRFLGERYRAHPNVVWLNGGDTRQEMRTAVWNALGTSIKQYDPNHLMTFHPFGRTASSWKFHRAPWLDFNMFQSGHRSYDQESMAVQAEDNWRYVEDDLARLPAKPTIDGEPPYENIPHGLHDITAPRWNAADARRFAWWSVMAGAFGHTYGENNVMQMFVPGKYDASFGANRRWDESLGGPASPGADQMRHLRALVEARSMGERMPDQSLIVDNGVRYNRVIASRGVGYAFAYNFTGRPFTMRLGAISGADVIAHWYSPRDGRAARIGTFANQGERRFDPPGEVMDGNDWVLVLDDASHPVTLPDEVKEAMNQTK